MSFLVQLQSSAYPAHAQDHFIASTPFSLDNARSMMWMAQLAYETPGDPDPTQDHSEAAAKKRIGDILGTWGMQLRGFTRNNPMTGLPGGSACAIVAGGRGATIVTYAGSDPLKFEDWITDFNAQPSADDVHRGFEQAVQDVWKEIGPAIRQRPPNENALFFTGHSLGGALAIVTADFATNNAIAGTAATTAVYTFGSPRTGGQTFFDSYTPRLGERTYRLIHGSDVVATVPPPLHGVFRHVGRSLQCPPDGVFDLQSQQLQAPDQDLPDFTASLQQGALSVLGRLAQFRLDQGVGPRPLDIFARALPPGLRDHVPANYFRALGIPLQQ
jgi:triacylglycerol lipase